MVVGSWNACKTTYSKPSDPTEAGRDFINASLKADYSIADDYVHVLQDADGFVQTALLVLGKVHLRKVAGDDRLGVGADTRQEHLQLEVGRVLRLVQDDERIVQRPAAHISQGRDFDHPGAHIIAQLVGGYHVIQRIVQRAQVRIDLFFQIARQKTKAFTGLDGRAGEDDLFDHLVLQGPYCQCNGCVGLTCTSRTDGEDDVVLVCRGHHAFLVDGTGTDSFPIRAKYQDVIGMPVDEMIYCLGIVATQYLLEIVLAYMTVSFQILH